MTDAAFRAEGDRQPSGVGANPMLPVPYRVRRFRPELPDTFTLELTPADGSDPPGWRPGQFNMLYVYGVGEVPISMSGDPAKPDRLVHTIRAVGAVTRSMSQLRRGDFVGVRGAYGSIWPIQETEGHDVVLVAGGIGLAPLRPAMYHLLAQRKRYGRIVLLYGTRTPEDLLYRAELEQWRSKFDLDVHVTVDRASRGWYGNVGVVTNLIARVPLDPTRASAFVCGPEVMMRFAALELQERGLNLDRIHISMERNMKCGLGLCGRCQWGPLFVCRDGPIFRYGHVKALLGAWEL